MKNIKTGVNAVNALAEELLRAQTFYTIKSGEALNELLEETTGKKSKIEILVSHNATMLDMVSDIALLMKEASTREDFVYEQNVSQTMLDVIKTVGVDEDKLCGCLDCYKRLSITLPEFAEDKIIKKAFEDGEFKEVSLDDNGLPDEIVQILKNLEGKAGVKVMSMERKQKTSDTKPDIKEVKELSDILSKITDLAVKMDALKSKDK